MVYTHDHHFRSSKKYLCLGATSRVLIYQGSLSSIFKTTPPCERLLCGMALLIGECPILLLILLEYSNQPSKAHKQWDLLGMLTLRPEFLRIRSRPIHMSVSNIWLHVCAMKSRCLAATASCRHVALLQFFSSYVSSFMASCSSCL